MAFCQVLIFYRSVLTRSLLTASKGENARSIFERAQLPNEVLGRIWNLADTEQKGQLGLTEFIIAMHLLSSFKNGSMRALPQILPAGLHEAAARRGIPRQTTGSRPTSDSTPVSAIPRQFSGAGYPNLARSPTAPLQQAASIGDQWAIAPQDKAQFDQIYLTVDTQNRGFITGEQAVSFFSNSRLPEDALAQIWDLADINSEGQLNRDEFAVAMYLIRQQRSKKDGRDVLPATLPPNLIPPSMRRQPIAPQQPTAPVFDNAPNITKPKSASEDLFGLDAISSPAPEPQAKAANDSLPTSPSRSQTLPPQTNAQQQASQFKPFIPTSSFGQSIMTPQGTGTSSASSPAVATRGLPSNSQPASAMDDLLGDNDPEVSKKLTDETSELANLSNQVSTLTNQMTEVKSNRGVAEQTLGQAQTQKMDFEARLAQLRAAYQKEVKEVQGLQERLRTSQEETKRLQSDMALIEGTHQDLQAQHQQVSQALAADQTENARLKEKISQTNAEINELKPQLEKLKMDARQQKGLVAIYKKQLAGSENERENIKSDMDSAANDHAEATREVEEHQRAVESVPKAVSSPPPVSAAPPATSPAPAGGSMNPFFRRPSNPTSAERGLASPFTPSSVASPNHNAFDSFFGPSAPASTQPPPTSFGTQQTSSPSAMPFAAGAIGAIAGAAAVSHSQGSSDEPGDPTPTASPPPSALSDSPQTAVEPPAPPQSRQITSSFLPLRPSTAREGSDTSSVRVMPPASRMGDRSQSGINTPITSETAVPESPKQHFEEVAASMSHKPEPVTDAAPQSLSETFGEPSSNRDVPGAFPGDDSPVQGGFKPSSSPYSSSGLDPRIDLSPRPMGGNRQTPMDDPFAKADTPTSNSVKDDFDSAFAGFGNKGKAPENSTHAPSTNGYEEAHENPQGEFPPIREVGDEDESDSEDDRGFDDNFTQHTTTGQPQVSQALPGQGSMVGSAGGLAPIRPPYNTAGSEVSQLPTPGAEASPPPYDPTAVSGSTAHGDQKSSESFPAEYSGLLPHREAAASPETGAASNSNLPNSASIDRGLNFFGDTAEGSTGHAQSSSPFNAVRSPMLPGASTQAPYAYTSKSPPPVQPSQPPAPNPTAPVIATQPVPKDEFDDFNDLTEAKEDDVEEELGFPRSTNQTFDDFNPTFDSPSASRTTAQGSTGSASFPPQSDAFSGFAPSAPSNGDAGASRSVIAPTETPSHNWDAIFAGLDGAQPTNGTLAAEDHVSGFSPPNGPPPAKDLGISNAGSSSGQKAGVGTVAPPDEAADDPILKRLTGMGYPREESLAALEKFDYNLDKVSSRD